MTRADPATIQADAAELDLLATLWRNPDELPTRAAPHVKAADFADRTRRALYEYLYLKHDAGTTPTETQALEYLQKLGREDGADLFDQLDARAWGLSTSRSAEAVARYAQRRRARELLRKLDKRLADPGTDTTAVIEDARASLDEIAAQPGSRGQHVAVGTSLVESLALFERRRSGEEPAVELPWANVNEALGGGLRAGVHMVVAPPKMGKTQFVLEAALHAARAGVPVLYLSLEMSRAEVDARLIALQAGAQGPKWSDLVNGKPLAEDAARKVQAAADEIAPLPFAVLEAGAYGFRADDLYNAARPFLREHGRTRGTRTPWVLIVDFLQLLSGDDKDARGRIGAAAYQCAALARDTGAVVFAVSSVAREKYLALFGVRDSGKDKSPQITPGKTDTGQLMGMGKESGEIEYAASSVLVLLREPYEDGGDSERHERRWLAVAALRAGENKTPWLRLRFRGGQRFENAQREDWTTGTQGSKTTKPKTSLEGLMR